MPQATQRLQAAVAPAGDPCSPRSFARVHQHRARLAADGIAVETISPALEPWDWFEAVLGAAERSDVLWLQNVVLTPRLARVLGRVAPNFVLDLSEPLDAACPVDPDPERVARIECLGATAGAAGLVVVDHPILADRIAALANDAVQVVPTRIPLDWPRRARLRERLVVGWPGALGLPASDLGEVLDAVAKPPLDARVRLRLIVDESQGELAVLTEGRHNVSIEVVRGEGLEPVAAAIDAVDLVCLPLPSDPWGPGLSPFAADLALSRGVPVAISAGAPCAAASPGPEWLRVDGDKGWSDLLGLAWEDREWLFEVACRGRASLARRSEDADPYGALAAALVRQAACARLGRYHGLH